MSEHLVSKTNLKMENSNLFVEFVHTFEDPDLLQEWAQEYGHDGEEAVQSHIAFLRTRDTAVSEVQNICDLQNRPNQVSFIQYLFCFKKHVKCI